jgi:hypothetical protein
VCPVAQVNDRLLFLVAEGSTAPCGAEVEGLPAGLVLAGTVERFPDRRDAATPAGSCWVVPPQCAGPALPPARVVLAALRSAYAQHQTATETKLV